MTAIEEKFHAEDKLIEELMQERVFEWAQAASQDDLLLQDRVYELEGYFGDMLFEEGTETKIHYNEKEVTLNRLKQAKRDGAGTKYRG